MRKQDAINHFGGVAKLAKELGCSTQAISQWPESIPQGRAYQIEVLTGGQLKAAPTIPVQPGETRRYQRVPASAKPQDHPCVKRPIAAALAQPSPTDAE